MDVKLLERGYKKYAPIPVLDSEIVVDRFQKRFDDTYGKKYFIDVVKRSQDFVPVNQRGEWWKPFSYEYEVQVSMTEDDNYIDLHFGSSWTIEQVEQFMENFFAKMQPNYYELWDTEERQTRPAEDK